MDLGIICIYIEVYKYVRSEKLFSVLKTFKYSYERNIFIVL